MYWEKCDVSLIPAILIISGSFSSHLSVWAGFRNPSHLAIHVCYFSTGFSRLRLADYYGNISQCNSVLLACQSRPFERSAPLSESRSIAAWVCKFVTCCCFVFLVFFVYCWSRWFLEVRVMWGCMTTECHRIQFSDFIMLMHIDSSLPPNRFRIAWS